MLSMGHIYAEHNILYRGAQRTVHRVTTLQTLKFPDNFLAIHGTPDHFNWYSYHACTTSVKVNDQTVKFIFDDNDFIMITS